MGTSGDNFWDLALEVGDDKSVAGGAGRIIQAKGPGTENRGDAANAPLFSLAVGASDARGRAEKGLSDSNLRWQRTLASLTEAVFIVQSGTRIIQDCNQAVEKMFGYTQQEMIGKSTSCLHISPEMSERFGREMRKSCQEKSRFETAFRMKHKDGAFFDSEHTVTLIHDENEANFSYVCVVRDISERKRHEDALQTKALVLESMSEGVAKFDENGAILFTNAALDAMFGQAKGELIGTQLPMLHGFRGPHERSLATVLASLGRQDTWCGELLHRRKDGSTIFCYARIREIPGNGHWVAVIEDITERKEMERMKDEMISAVSHEMRTPMTALLGYHQLLSEGEVDETVKGECLHTMYQETLRLNELIGNFLDLQQLKSRGRYHRMDALQLKPLLESAASLGAATSMKHRIRLELGGGLPCISGDEECLSKVFNNLLSNAIKYSPRGGDIILGAEAIDDGVTVWVKDAGIGIPQEALGKIFDRFYRVDNTDRRRSNGTGLGLALVQEIVRIHGGEIWAESSAGAGSSFYVSLPALRTEHSEETLPCAAHSV